MIKSKMIKTVILFTFLMILSSFQGDSLEYIVTTRVANFEFFHIMALLVTWRIIKT